jgi:hypothetical protein
MIKKYKAKVTDITAIQLLPTLESIKQVLKYINKSNIASNEVALHGKYNQAILDGGLTVPNLRGDLKASFNDYIIKDLRGDFFPCSPEVFHNKYKEIE